MKPAKFKKGELVKAIALDKDNEGIEEMIEMVNSGKYYPIEIVDEMPKGVCYKVNDWWFSERDLWSERHEKMQAIMKVIK
jgi:hypothetical protein